MNDENKIPATDAGKAVRKSLKPDTAQEGIDSISDAIAAAPSPLLPPTIMRIEDIDKDPKLVQAYNLGFNAGLTHLAIADEKQHLRDEFAWAFMSGAVANHGQQIDAPQAAKKAYEMADAMLEARENKKK